MNLIRRLFSSDDAPPKELLCPHCERPLNDKHTEANCQRGHSRRFFVQMLAGCVVVATVPKSIERAAATVLATPEHVRQEERRQKAAGVGGHFNGHVIIINGDYEITSTWLSRNLDAISVLKQQWAGMRVFYSREELGVYRATNRAMLKQSDGGLLVVENHRPVVA
jgi:hypothetical protein